MYPWGQATREVFSKNWTLSLSPNDFTCIASAAKENVELRSRVKGLEQQVSSLQHGLHGLRKRSSSDDVEYYLRRLKKQRAANSLASLSWLRKEGLKPLKLEVLNIQTQKTETICLDTVEELLGFEEEECVSEDQLDIVSMMLYVKDRFNVSGCAYHEMAKLCQEMPRHYKLKERIKQLNTLWKIRPTPNGVVGVQQSLKVTGYARPRTSKA